MPHVSYVVTCYNFAPFIGECLESVLTQSATNDFEVIVVDDASTDDSDSVIRTFDDGRIRYTRHLTNQGGPFTLQEAMLQARGEFIAQLGGDDRYRPHYTSRVLPVLEREPRVGMAYGDVAQMNREGRIVQDPWLENRSRELHGGRSFIGDEYLALLQEDFVPFSTIMFRRTVLEGILPMPDGLFFLDWYLVLRIARRFHLAYIAETLADYRIHGRNRFLTIRTHREHAETIIRILDQNFSEPDHQPQKEQLRKRVYTALYHHLAENAFGAGDMEYARAFYFKALLSQPIKLLDPTFARHLGGTWLGIERYNSYKARWLRRTSVRS
jgi:glycosyltransferase involved in cell wall biosynthesis